MWYLEWKREGEDELGMTCVGGTDCQWCIKMDRLDFVKKERIAKERKLTKINTNNSAKLLGLFFLG